MGPILLGWVEMLNLSSVGCTYLGTGLGSAKARWGWGTSGPVWHLSTETPSFHWVFSCWSMCRYAPSRGSCFLFGALSKSISVFCLWVSSTLWWVLLPPRHCNQEARYKTLSAASQYSLPVIDGLTQHRDADTCTCQLSLSFMFHKFWKPF